jgi:hypothetical protein
MRATCALVGLLCLAGCGGDDDNRSDAGGPADLAVGAIGDLAGGTSDLLLPTQCSPTDPMTDGTPCSAGCPSNTFGVNLGGACKCYYKCTVDPECSCNRLCDPLSLPDGGVIGSACLPGNDPGTRCGRDASGHPFGNVFCSQLSLCVNADPAGAYRYCNYKCTAQTVCPAQTTCVPVTDAMGMPLGSVCAYTSGPNGTKNAGDACSGTDICKTGLLCDGVCRSQCDGPGAPCASGTCTRLDDPATSKVIGYVCK